jgi:hypothetical protein
MPVARDSLRRSRTLIWTKVRKQCLYIVFISLSKPTPKGVVMWDRLCRSHMGLAEGRFKKYSC